MSQGIPSGYVLPTPQRAKLVGTLNVIFASLLLIYFVAQLGLIFAGPILQKFGEDTLKQTRARVDQQRKDQMAALKKEAAEAKTAEEKAALVARIGALEKVPAMPLPDLQKMNEKMQTPGMRVLSWSLLLTGLALNLAMLFSGIGLLRLREKARRLAIGTFGLKIVRLCLESAITIVFVIPMMSEMMPDLMPGVPPGAGSRTPFPFSGGDLARIQAVASTVMSVLIASFGSIWPVVGLVLLTRPGTRAACRASSSKPAAIESELL
jgi:hypothetical protein